MKETESEIAPVTCLLAQGSGGTVTGRCTPWNKCSTIGAMQMDCLDDLVCCPSFTPELLQDKVNTRNGL